MSEGRQPTQALALLAPGRRPRAEEERPESSNIHPGLPGPGQGQCRGRRCGSPWPRPPLLPGCGQIPAPSAAAPGVVPHPRMGEGIMEQTAHLASRLFRSSQRKGRGLSSGPPPPLERGQAQAVWPALGTHLLGHSPVPWHCHPQRMPPQMPSGLSPAEQCPCLVSLISAPRSRALWASAPASQLWV